MSDGVLIASLYCLAYIPSALTYLPQTPDLVHVLLGGKGKKETVIRQRAFLKNPQNFQSNETWRSFLVKLPACNLKIDPGTSTPQK